MVSSLVMLLYRAALKRKYDLRACMITRTEYGVLLLASPGEMFTHQLDGTPVKWKTVQEVIDEQQ